MIRASILNVFLLELGGAFGIMLIGSLLHFTYDWSGSRWWVGIFSTVNESIWEHLKMVYYPTLFWTILEMIFGIYPVQNLLFARSIAMLLMLAIIIVGFDSYTIFSRRAILYIDASLFGLSILAGQAIALVWLTADPLPNWSAWAGGAVILILLGMFFGFTFFPPHLSLFEHKALQHTRQYGILLKDLDEEEGDDRGASMTS